MTAVWIIMGAVAVVLLAGGLHSWSRRRARARVAARPLADKDQALLRRRVPLYRRLPEPLRADLDRLIQLFLHEMSFEACGGLRAVTDEMRLVIASQACLMLLRSGYKDFGLLRSILIYPDAFVVQDEFGLEDIRLGESWDTGSVVLSWETVRSGARDPEDGLNVVLHEFAHQIDQANGEADGLPLLKQRGDYREWAEAFRASYESLRERVERGERTVLDDYGATDPAEFFAVATETFFELPLDLQQEHPEVYEQLVRIYGLDPLEW